MKRANAPAAETSNWSFLLVRKKKSFADFRGTLGNFAVGSWAETEGAKMFDSDWKPPDLRGTDAPENSQSAW